MNHIVQFSGGIGSWAAAKRVIAKQGEAVLLFADTLMEDEDLYRFLKDAAENLGPGAELIHTAEGRDPWQVFFDVRFLGNTRIDPCSQVLKRAWLREWMTQRYDPEDTTVYLGIDWSEEHRMEGARERWAPWHVEAPLCDPPYLDKEQLVVMAQEEGLEPPRLYAMGFPHNNCGGFCVKAGQGHFKLLLETMPERYAYHERREQELRAFLGKDIAILRDRRGGKTKPLTLRKFRKGLQKGTLDADVEEWGGCGCAVS